MRDMNRILLFTKVVYLISITWSAKLGWTLLLNTESACIRKVLIYYKPWCAKLSVYHGKYNLHNFPQCYQKVHQFYIFQLFVFQHSLMIYFFIWFNKHSFKIPTKVTENLLSWYSTGRHLIVKLVLFLMQFLIPAILISWDITFG